MFKPIIEIFSTLSATPPASKYILVVPENQQELQQLFIGNNLAFYGLHQVLLSLELAQTAKQTWLQSPLVNPQASTAKPIMCTKLRGEATDKLQITDL